MLYGEVIEKIENKLSGIGRALDETDRAALVKILRKWDEAGAVSLQKDEKGTTLSFGTARGFSASSAKDDWMDSYFMFGKRGGGRVAGTPENPVSHIFRLAADGLHVTKDNPPAAKAETDKFNKYKMVLMDAFDTGVSALELNEFLSPASYEAAGEKILDRVLAYFGTIDPAAVLFGDDKDTAAQACRQDIVAILGDFEKQRRHGAALRFLAGVDREIRKTLHRAGFGSDTAMEWLNSDGDAQRQKYRHQAGRAYPVLMPLFVGGRGNGLHAKSIQMDRFLAFSKLGAQEEHDAAATPKVPVASAAELQAVIDGGKPLAAFLQSHKLPGDVGPFSKATLKALGAIRRMPHSLNSEDMKRLSHLNDVPPAWHPADGKTLIAFVESVKLAEGFEKLSGRPVKEILGRTRGQWAAWNAKMGSPEDMKIAEEWLTEVSNVLVKPRRFAVAPGLMEQKKSDMEEMALLLRVGEKKTGVADNTRRKLIGPAAETEIMDCARRWRDQREGYVAKKELMRQKFTPQEEAAIENESWLGLAEPMQAPNGLWIRSLVSMKEFKEAGRELAICVGSGPSYALKCLTKPHHVVCLSEDRDCRKKVSTAELVELEEDGGIHLARRQHQKYGKDLADERQEAALQWYMSTVKPDYPSIAAARNERCRRLLRNQVAEDIGFDALDPESCRRAWELIGPYLPHFLHHMSFEELPAKAGIDDAINESLNQRGKDTAREIKDMQAYERNYIEQYIRPHRVADMHEEGHMPGIGARLLERMNRAAREPIAADFEAVLNPNRMHNERMILIDEINRVPRAGLHDFHELPHRLQENFVGEGGLVPPAFGGIEKIIAEQPANDAAPAAELPDIAAPGPAAGPR